jgi:hypothetical protein
MNLRSLCAVTYAGALCLLLAASCAELRPEGVLPGGHDWAKVITVNQDEGIYLDRQTGRNFECREFFLPRWGDNGFSEGLCAVKERLENKHWYDKGKEGYIDRAGRLVIPFQYDYANNFHEGYAVATVGKARGLIDKRGRWFVEPGRYDALDGFREGRCAFKEQNRWGFLDAEGRVVIRPIYKEVAGFCEGLSWVKEESGATVYIDRNGRVCIRLPDAEWKGCNFQEGLARVTRYLPVEEGGPLDWLRIPRANLYGYIAKDGRMAIEPRFGTAGDFSEGLAPVTMSKDSPVVSGGELIYCWSFDPDFPEPPPAWGFINKKGEVVIPMVYEKALHFREGLAPVKQGGKWGYIDRQGRMVIGAGFVWAEEFKDGIAEVVIGEKTTYIDKSGRIVVWTDISADKF